MAGKGNSAKRDTRRADYAEKCRKALDLRRLGKSYDDIGRTLKLVDKSHARKLVQEAIASIPREAAEEVRELEIARLDRMLDGLAVLAESGDLDAVDRSLKIQVRRAALLGLDAPKKQEVTGANGGPIEVAAAGDRVRGRLGRLAIPGGTGSGTPEPSSNT